MTRRAAVLFCELLHLLCTYHCVCTNTGTLTEDVKSHRLQPGQLTCPRNGACTKYQPHQFRVGAASRITIILAIFPRFLHHFLQDGKDKPGGGFHIRTALLWLKPAKEPFSWWVPRKRKSFIPIFEKNSIDWVVIKVYMAVNMEACLSEKQKKVVMRINKRILVVVCCKLVEGINWDELWKKQRR